MTVREEIRDARHLVSGVVEDTRHLVSSYGELFKLDLRAELSHAKSGMIAGMIAAYAAGAGILLLGFALAHGLTLWIAWTLATSFLVVGAAVVAVALLAALAMWRQVKKTGPPEALGEAKEDARWIRENV